MLTVPEDVTPVVSLSQPAARHRHEAAAALLLRADGDVAANLVAVGRVRHHKRAAADVEVVVGIRVAGDHKGPGDLGDARALGENERHALVDERAPVGALAQPRAVRQREGYALRRTELGPEVEVERAVLPYDVAGERGIADDVVHAAAEVESAAGLRYAARGVDAVGERERPAALELKVGGVDRGAKGSSRSAFHV